MNRLTDYIKRYSGWNTIVELSRIKGFPGHRDISVYEVISFFVAEIKRDSIIVRASSISFNFFVSLFPTILVVFTVIPYIPVPSFQQSLLDTMGDVLPANVYILLNETIHDIVMRQQGGLLSISLLLAIYYSSRGVISMMNSFDKALPTFRKRNFINRELVALKITGLLFTLMVVSIIFFTGGEVIIKWIMKGIHAENDTAYFWFTIVRWITIIVIVYFSISLVYYYGPATHERWRFFTAGSTLATVLSILSSILFSWIIDQFGQYNRLYGSIGTFIVLLLWIYYNSMSLLIGFELNASIEMNRYRNEE